MKDLLEQMDADITEVEKDGILSWGKKWAARAAWFALADFCLSCENRLIAANMTCNTGGCQMMKEARAKWGEKK